MRHGSSAGARPVRERVEWMAVETSPLPDEVLRLQGVPADHGRQPAITALVEKATAIYVELAEPRSIVEEITREQFSDVYHGDGANRDETPLDDIFPRAERLALFAATVGARVETRISVLFDEREFALACMLDAAASAAADGLTGLLGTRYLAVAEGAGANGLRVLAYSPGYCGWHVSGQRKLFDFLQPEEIGIKLNASCLMQPLKSVSGVLVAGQSHIHVFSPTFPFCERCVQKQCRVRMVSVL